MIGKKEQEKILESIRRRRLKAEKREKKKSEEIDKILREKFIAGKGFFISKASSF